MGWFKEESERWEDGEAILLVLTIALFGAWGLIIYNWWGSPKEFEAVISCLAITILFFKLCKQIIIHAVSDKDRAKTLTNGFAWAEIIMYALSVIGALVVLVYGPTP